MRSMAGMIPVPLLAAGAVMLLSISAIGFTMLAYPTIRKGEQPEPSASTQPTSLPDQKTAAPVPPPLTPQPSSTPKAKPAYRLDSVTPNTARAGEYIVLRGAGFGTSPLYVKIQLQSVTIGLQPQTSEEYWRDDEIKVKIPDWASTRAGHGRIGVEKMTDPKYTNDLDFTILSNDPNASLAPALEPYREIKITSITPDHGKVGTIVTIKGVGSGDKGGTVPVYSVYVGSKTAAVQSWSDTQITAMIPDGLPVNQGAALAVFPKDSTHLSSAEFFYVGE